MYIYMYICIHMCICIYTYIYSYKISKKRMPDGANYLAPGQVKYKPKCKTGGIHHNTSQSDVPPHTATFATTVLRLSKSNACTA